MQRVRARLCQCVRAAAAHDPKNGLVEPGIDRVPSELSCGQSGMARGASDPGMHFGLVLQR